jgi:3-isopropylmalate dehydratase small subunit
MATEMAGIISLFPPNQEVLDYCSGASQREVKPLLADDDATYASQMEIDIEGLVPQISKPGHPEDVTDVAKVAGQKIGSAFIGSCTNGRYEDMKTAAEILKGQKVAPGVVLKIVPSTDKVWRRCLQEGLLEIFKKAGALVGNAGCAGCAAGQIGQNGPGEITISTGNRNFAGKQGKGEVYLASPAVVTASAISGVITTPDKILTEPVLFAIGTSTAECEIPKPEISQPVSRPTNFKGRVWVIAKDNIDTDMIYHNRYLTITDINEMGKYTFDNLEGWEDFAQKVKPDDIVVVGKNFGAGSSRQQAVDCFESLGVSLVIAESFGSIYERNAINKGFPIMVANLISTNLTSGETIEVDLEKGVVILPSGNSVAGLPFADVQLEIYKKGGLLKKNP